MIVWGALGGFSGIFPFSAFDIQKAKAATFSMQTGYYVGTGASKSITGLGFTPNLVMIKADDASGVGMVVKSSAMPASNSQLFGGAAANDTNTLITLDADGFTVSSGANVNTSGVRWEWVAFGGSDCTASGTFCVGTYSGTGAAQSINTGFQPDLVVTRDASTVAAIWKSSSMGANENNYFHAAVADTGGQMIKTLDASGFTVGTGNNANQNGHTFYFFAFKQVAGAMDVGTYTGTGANKTISSSDDAGLTFQSDFTFMKNSTNAAASGVATFDRGNFSVAFTDLAAGGNYFREQTSTGGFKVGTFSSVNGSGAPMYYATFGGAASPTTGGTFRYASGTYTGTGSALSVTGLGFRPDLVIVKGAAAQYAFWRSSNVPGDKSFYLGFNGAGVAALITSIDNDGFSIGTNGNANTNGVVHYWEAFGNAWNPETNTGSKDFTIGAYTGSGVDSRDIFRLPFTPDLVAVKDSPALSVTSWRTSAMSGDLAHGFNTIAAQADIIQSIGDHSFQVGVAAQPYETNTSGEICYFFAFASSSYFSVGTYTGTGVAQDITGIGNDPDLVWVQKRSGGTARAGMFLANNLTDGNSQYFVSTANAANKITALGTNLFTVGTGNETNENTFTYDYASWESPPTSTPSVAITESSGTTNVTEAGGTDTYTVVLNFRPSATVTVNLSPDSYTTLSTTSITFTTSNWNTPQTITVTAVNDSVAQGTYTSTISHSASSSDTNFNGVSISSVTANITDNDSAGVTVTQSGGSTDITEAGATDSYTLVLTSAPTTTVELTLSANSQCTLSTSTVDFSSASWNNAVTVTVTAVNDSVAEGAHTCAITQTASSTSANYNGVSVATVTANVTDNDTVGVTASAISGNTTEVGGTATFTVVLNSQPTGTVEIPISTGDATEGTVNTSTLTFVPATWNTAHTVTVTGVDDSVDDGNIAYTIVVGTVSSTDSGYNGVNPSDVNVTNTDNDTAGVTVVESDGSTDIAEGGATDSYTIVLNSQPTATVNITLASDAQSTLSSSTIVFTTANWNVAKTITVTAVDDILNEGPHTSTITHSATSTDIGYDSIVINDVVANITDNDDGGGGDIAGFDVSVISGDTTEGGGFASFTVVLTAAPLGTVTTTVHSDDASEGTPDTSELVFNPGNWNIPQTVTVTGVDDSVADGDIGYSIILDAAASPDDPAYAGMDPSDVIVTNLDNDVVGITLSETAASTDVTEGGFDDSYDLVLTSQPTANVTITITPDDQVSVSTSSVVFTPGNWDTPKTITVTAIDDAIAEGLQFSTITNVAASADPDYNAFFVNSVFPTITDNDTADVILTDAGIVDVTEGGLTDSYTIELGSEPTANVVISLTPDAQVNLSTTSITFTPATWNAPRTITVTAVDDAIAEDFTFGTISTVVTSLDGNYNAFAVGDVFPSVHDNDTATITQTESDGVTEVTEGGATDSYTIVLTSEPTASVTIDLTNDAQITLSTTSLLFDNTNWNTPKTITVTAVDDHISESPVFSTITANVSSADLFYNGFALGNIDVSVVDNDNPGVTLVESGDSTDVAEGGATDSYTLVLNSEPTNDVTIAVSVDAGATVSTSSITFTPATWDTARTVTVTAIDDAIAEGGHIATVSNDATSADGDYNGIFIPLVSANITDNDSAGVTVTQSGGTTNITEGGATDTYTIQLTSEPVNPVVITVSPDAQSTVSTSSVTFTAETWNIARTVTVTAVDDVVVEGDHTSTLTHAAVSDDPNYNAILIDDVVANVTDNDSPGITVSAASGDTTEGGATATFTLVLNTLPTGNVEVPISIDDPTEGSVNTSTVTFTVDTWNIPHTVTITGVNDDIDDGNQPLLALIGNASSTDGNYNNLAPDSASVMLANIDDDTAGVTVVESAGTTDIEEGEGGAVDTYTIVLDSAPVEPVVITISPDAQSTVSSSSLRFTSTTWSSPRTVTVISVDDAIVEGPHTTTLTHAAVSDDPTYNGILMSDVVANVTDNDTVGVTVSAISGDTTEAGGSATFTVVLNSQPTGTVEIPVSTLDATEGTVNTSTLTFTADTWDTIHTVTVTGVDDSQDDGDIIYAIVLDVVSSTDGNYNGFMPGVVNVTNTDNDAAGFTVSAISQNTTEAGVSATYTVVLNSQPTNNVEVGVSSSDVSEGTVNTSTLTFTSATWNVAHTVTVTGVDDVLGDGDIGYTIINAAASSSDVGYDGMNPNDVAVTNIDNDTFGVTASAISGNTTEVGGTATFTVVLNTQPDSSVEIPVSTGDATEGTVNTSTLTFTPATWNVAHTVTVTGVDDALDDGDIGYTIVLGSASSSDVGYDGVNPDDVAVTNIDNDTVGVTITESDGTTDITEAGATDSYTLVLDTEPTASVTITLTPDADSTLSTSSVVFTTANWNIAKTVTVTAVDDILLEGDHTSTITHTAGSLDGAYNELPINDVVANVTDNDTAGVTVSAISGNTTEVGGTATFTVVLNTQPTHTVEIPISSFDSTEGTVNTSTLTFTVDTWDVAHTVTVTGADDAIDDGDILYSIVVGLTSSTDGNYDGINPNDVNVTNSDNDVAGVTLVESGDTTTVTEGGATDTYTLVLSSEPVSDVTITVTPDAQSTVSTSSLLFTSTTWNIARTITVTAVNDILVEGPHASTITHAADSLDVVYDGVLISDVVANVTDNDSSGITLTESGGITNITEGGATDTYTLVLNSQPTDIVDVTVTPDADSTVSTGTIRFNTATWNIPVTVTVTAVNNALAEGNHISTITHTAASADGDYDAVAIDSVSAHITDNDSAGVTIAQSGGITNIAEGGATDSYTVVLTSVPTSTVTITVTPDVQSEVSTSSIVFTSTTWNIPVTVTVSAVDDLDIEGPHNSTITHTAASDCANYNEIVIADVTAHIIDNDEAGVTIAESDGTTDITEGGREDSYTIVLNALPTADVTITVTADANSTVSTSSILFTVANWNVPVTVTSTAVDDALSQGPHISTITHTAASEDLSYNEIPVSDVVATITDNDTAGFTVSAISGDTSEVGATSTYTIVLNSEPSADVTITVTSSAPNEGTVSTSSFVFTALNWNIPVTVTVTGVDDAIDDGDVNYTIIHGAAVSADGSYNGAIPDEVDVTNIDNDTAGVTLTESGGDTSIAEAGVTDSYTLVLDTQPTENVTITLTPDDQSTVSTSSVTFTAETWNIARTVTVSAVNDPVIEGDHTSTITHTVASADGNYDGFVVADVTSNITDNDIAGFTVSAISGDTSEAGDTATFTVVLNTQPTSAVTTTVSSSDLTEGTVNTTTLVFTSDTWNMPHTVTVTGVDDHSDDGDVDYSVVLGVAESGDENYNGINPNDVSVTNVDDDGIEINTSQSGGTTNVVEGGATDSYTMVLGTEPTSDVVITLTPDAQTTVSTSSITFTNLNWDIPVTITVTAVDDTNIEGNHTSTITHTATSLDEDYDALPISDLVVAITDNDERPDTGGVGSSITIPTVPVVPVVPKVISQNTTSPVQVVIFHGEDTVENFSLRNTSHTATRVSADNDEAILILRSEPITLHLKKGIAQVVDTDKNGAVDLSVVYNGMENNNPKFTFTELQELQAVSINNGAKQTPSMIVHLQFNVVNAAMVAISNEPNFAGATFQTFTTSTIWTLSPGAGHKTVFVRFRSKSGGNFDTNATIDLTHMVTPCTLDIGSAYKSPVSNAVYYITAPYDIHGQPKAGTCTKRPFKASSIFFSYFKSWNDVHVISVETLQGIANDELGFMPHGPLYEPQNGTLMKNVSDPNVYFLVNGRKQVIASENVFLGLGFHWNQVEDVSPDLLDAIALGDPITESKIPAYTIIKYADSPRLYWLEADVKKGEALVKRYIVSETAWKQLNYRSDRIITVSPSVQYEDGAPVGETNHQNEAYSQISQSVTVSFTRPLSSGDVGEEVRNLQRILASQGFFDHEITGLFGPVTVDAVKAFQKSHGLEPLGIVGPGTRNILNSI